MLNSIYGGDCPIWCFYCGYGSGKLRFAQNMSQPENSSIERSAVFRVTGDVGNLPF